MKKDFTLRIMRCLLIGIGAFVMILALKIRIRSGVDVAGYVLGAGGLWYIFEMIVIAPKKTRPPTEVEKQFHAQKQARLQAKLQRDLPPKKPKSQSLGEDHF